MNRIMIKGVVLAALSLTSMAAMSDNTETLYAGVQYAVGSFKTDGAEEVNPTAVIGKFGKHMNRHFALESRLGVGLKDDSTNVLGTDVSLELDTLLGAYAVGYLHLPASISAYGLIGVTRAEATASAPGFPSVSDDESGFSYGAGVDIGIAKDVAINLEHIQYLNQSEFELAATGVGITFRF